MSPLLAALIAVGYTAALVAIVGFGPRLVHRAH